MSIAATPTKADTTAPYGEPSPQPYPSSRTRFIPPLRTLLHTSVAVLLMGALALPLADKVVTLKMGRTTSVIHYEYLPVTYRYWREKTVKEDSMKKSRSSIALVSAGTVFATLMPTLAMLRLDIPLLVLVAISFFLFLYSVANMRIGYHFFNQSAGAKQVGELSWGPSQTLHSAVAFIFLCLLVLLSIEQCCVRRCGSDTTKAKWATKWLTPMRRRALILVPVLAVLVLAVTGSGTAQAINHKNPAYTTAWHYTLMSFDYSLGYVRENMCQELFRTLTGAAAVAALACLFAFVGAVLSVFMVGKSTTSQIVMAVLALAFTVAAVGVTAELRNPIACEPPLKPQGALRLSQGFICLCGALFLGLVNVILSIVTRNITEEYVGAAALFADRSFPPAHVDDAAGQIFADTAGPADEESSCSPLSSSEPVMGYPMSTTHHLPAPSAFFTTTATTGAAPAMEGEGGTVNKLSTVSGEPAVVVMV